MPARRLLFMLHLKTAMGGPSNGKSDPSQSRSLSQFPDHRMKTMGRKSWYEDHLIKTRSHQGKAYDSSHGCKPLVEEMGTYDGGD